MRRRQPLLGIVTSVLSIVCVNSVLAANPEPLRGAAAVIQAVVEMPEDAKPDLSPDASRA